MSKPRNKSTTIKAINGLQNDSNRPSSESAQAMPDSLAPKQKSKEIISESQVTSKNIDSIKVGGSQGSAQRWQPELPSSYQQTLPTQISDQERANIHYVGFDNATLLSYKHNPKNILYTSGLIGCNLLVLTSRDGTYMAHINGASLKTADPQDIVDFTQRTIDIFTEKLGKKPATAYVLTGEITDEPNENIVKALRNSKITIAKETHADEFKITVGSSIGFAETFPGVGVIQNSLCTENNLLLGNLQWGELPQPESRVDRSRSSVTTRSDQESSRAQESPAVVDSSRKYQANNVSSVGPNEFDAPKQPPVSSSGERRPGFYNNNRPTKKSPGRADRAPSWRAKEEDQTQASARTSTTPRKKT